MILGENCKYIQQDPSSSTICLSALSCGIKSLQLLAYNETLEKNIGVLNDVIEAKKRPMDCYLVVGGQTRLATSFPEINDGGTPDRS